MGTEDRGVLQSNLFLKGSSQGRRVSPDRSRPASSPSGKNECPQITAGSSRARHPSSRPGGERTQPDDSHVTPPRPWGSPQPLRPFPHIRRAAHPPCPSQPMACRSAPRATSAHARTRQSPPARRRPPHHWLPHPSVRLRPTHLPQSAPLQPAPLPVTGAAATTRARRPCPMPRPSPSA